MIDVLLTPDEIKQAEFITRNCAAPQERDAAQCRKLLGVLKSNSKREYQLDDAAVYVMIKLDTWTQIEEALK